MIMHKIDTLVSDIYDLFDEGADVSDEIIEDLGKAIANTVKERLKAYKEERKPYLRLSNLGRKDRQLYYELNGYDKELLQANTKIKFLYGDILEHLLVFLVKAAGHDVRGEQTKLSIDGVEGSRDLVIDDVTTDIKSASTFSFIKFRDGKIVNDDPFGYIAQLSAYTEGDKTTNQNFSAFLVIDKTLGHICLSKVDSTDLINPHTRVKEIKAALSSKELPKRCYEDVPQGKSGNMKLGVGCSYCPFRFECWKDSNDGKGLQQYNYSTGVEFLTKVVKEPRVEKVQDD